MKSTTQSPYGDVPSPALRQSPISSEGGIKGFHFAKGKVKKQTVESRTSLKYRYKVKRPCQIITLSLIIIGSILILFILYVILRELIFFISLNFHYVILALV